jgi:hypothetical protein
MVTVICLLVWAGSGCAGTSHPTTIVCGTCEESDRFVRLQTPPNPSSSAAQVGFSHPLKLSPENWEPLLTSIRVRPVINFLMKGDEEPAFTPEEVDYLSMTLSRAFAKASPEQWVIFGLSNPVSTSGSEMTTGAWYVEGTTLHLLLPNFHAPVRMDNLRQVLNRDPLFEVLNATRYEFISTEYADEGSGKQSLLSFVRDETPHLAIEYELLLAGGPSPKKSQEDEVVEAQSEKSGKRDIPPSSLDDRLATLKRLKDQNLITEEDYQRKKQALLDQL